MTAKPEIVSSEDWQQTRDDLLKAEKEATRTLDAIAARRRRLPMVSFAADYAFDTPTGPKSLLDLFGPGAACRLPVHGPRTRRVLSRLHLVHQ